MLGKDGDIDAENLRRLIRRISDSPKKKKDRLWIFLGASAGASSYFEIATKYTRTPACLSQLDLSFSVLKAKMLTEALRAAGTMAIFQIGSDFDRVSDFLNRNGATKVRIAVTDLSDQAFVEFASQIALEFEAPSFTISQVKDLDELPV